MGSGGGDDARGADGGRLSAGRDGLAGSAGCTTGPGADSGRPGAGKTETVVCSVAAGISTVGPGTGSGAAVWSGTTNAAASPRAAASSADALQTIALMFEPVSAEITRMRYRRPRGDT